MAASATTDPEEGFASSSSSSRHTWTYEVFLSFRGEDTRHGFTSHLYQDLQRCGIIVFRDDTELRKGETISSELLCAIEESRIAVVVLSQNYAASRWCLDELVKIMECRTMERQMVLPIFYQIDPSDVRNQRGSFAEAFEKHQERYSTDKVLRWRTALTDPSNLSGWRLYSNGSESAVVGDISDHIFSSLMRKFLFVALYPVGIDPRVENVAPLLCVEVDAVRMVGIWGMGGVGKTSLSKAIYNKFFDDFEGKSFISDIRETCKQSGGRLQLIKKLVSDTVVGSNKEITNTDSGIHIIRERLRQRKVLVILDNVDHWKQVEDITASRNCFGSGSRIIITSRDKRLLEKLRVDAIYKAEVMNREESLELFSWHAFGSSKPTKDYMDLSSSVIDYCGGLPLALEV